MRPDNASRILARLSVTLFLFAGIAGCRENAMVTNYKTDDAFIRVPGEADSSLPKATGPFFELSKGSQWQYSVQIVDKNGTTAEAGELLAAGTRKIENQDGSVLQTILNGHLRKEDVYSIRPDGVYLLATGTPNANASLSPPILIYNLPIVEGETHSWTGLLHFQGNSGYGTALSRVSGHAKMVTDAGSFDAYRIDLIIVTTMNGKRQSVPLTRWIAPGVGIVNQRELNGTSTEIWNLRTRPISSK